MADITFIIGEEDLLAECALDRLKDNDTSVRVINSDITDEDEYWLNSFSFDSAPKLLAVEVEELPAMDGLCDALSSGRIVENLVVVCKKAKTNTKIYKWLEKNAKVVKCGKLNNTLFDKFLRRSNGNVHMNISEENLSYLKERLDYSSGRISLREIDILMRMFSLLDEVTKEDIDTYVNASAERKAFDIVGYLARKDFAGAVKAAGEYDDSCIMAISAILWEFKLAISLKTFAKEEVGATPFQAGGVKTFLEYDLDVLESVFHELNTSLKRMKSGMPEKACFVATVGIVADILK